MIITKKQTIRPIALIGPSDHRIPHQGQDLLDAMVNRRIGLRHATIGCITDGGMAVDHELFSLQPVSCHLQNWK